jgi:putative restriction endonuclease
LEQPLFLDERDWIEAPEWKPNIQRGRTYRLDTEPGLTMWRALEVRLGASPLPIELVDRLLRESGAARYGSPMFVLPRLGQGSFQMAVVDAYRRRCAVTGEKVLPVLESAHIKPYADGGEHRVDNGMLLRSDIHGPIVYTVGHSTHSLDKFVEARQHHPPDRAARGLTQGTTTQGRAGTGSRFSLALSHSRGWLFSGQLSTSRFPPVVPASYGRATGK